MACSSIVFAQVADEFDRDTGSRDKAAQVGSRDDWVVAQLGQQVFLWNEVGASHANEDESTALPTGFCYDRESRELYQFRGTNFVDALIQLVDLFPNLIVDDILNSDEEFWSLWNSPATFSPSGQWSLVTYESLDLKAEDSIAEHDGEKRETLVDPCIPEFAPPGEEGDDASDPGVKWQSATFARAPLFSLLGTLNDDICYECNYGNCQLPRYCCGNICCRGRCSGCPHVPNELYGGTIDVYNNPACPGEVITFVASGVIDPGSHQYQQCRRVTIPPGVVVYEWVIFGPSGLYIKGGGQVATVLATEPGDYVCCFHVTVDRECPPDHTLEICAFATVPYYPTIKLQYNTFIHCEYIQAGWPGPAWPFYSGDGRFFGSSGSSRTYQRVFMTVDPGIEDGLVGTPDQGNFPTNGYITLNANPPPPNPAWCDFLCRFTTGPGQQPNCTENGPLDFEVIPSRVNNEQVKVRFHVFARAGCSTPLITPAIDVDLSVFIKQTCSNGTLAQPVMRIEGTADKFPWHELIVNQTNNPIIDPCLLLTDGFALTQAPVSVSSDWVPVP